MLWKKNFWGIDVSTLDQIAEELMSVFNRYQKLLKTKTRDTSEQGLNYLKGCLLLEKDRNYKNIDRKVSGDPQADGQAIQQFMSDSPWSSSAVFEQVRMDIKDHEALHGGTLNFDESGEEASGSHKAGVSRQYLGRLGKVDNGQVGVLSSYSLNNIWLLVAAQLYLPKKWFSAEYRKKWKSLHIPSSSVFYTKLQLAWMQFEQALSENLPFNWVGGDCYYGQSIDFRWHIADQGKSYVFSVPCDTCVWLNNPLVESPDNVYSTELSQSVENLAATVEYETIDVRWCERGVMAYEHAFIPVWVVKTQGKIADRVARQEILIIRKEHDGKLSYALSNALQASKLELAQQRSERYFVERTIQDCKSELGWDDLQALKYRAYMHALAISAMGLVFAAQVKIKQRQKFLPIEQVEAQAQVKQLPDLSLSNVKELLNAAMPLPQLSKQQACDLVVQKLFNRTQSTKSRYQKYKRQHQISEIT